MEHRGDWGGRREWSTPGAKARVSAAPYRGSVTPTAVAAAHASFSGPVRVRTGTDAVSRQLSRRLSTSLAKSGLFPMRCRFRFSPGLLTTLMRMSILASDSTAVAGQILVDTM